MFDDRARFGASRSDVARLHAFLGVPQRALVGAIGDREALHADAETRRVHHDEHVLQAFVGLADQVAGRAAVLAVVERAEHITRLQRLPPLLFAVPSGIEQDEVRVQLRVKSA